MPEKANNIDPEDLYSTKNFFNRELSLIEFNRRVLNEAEGNQHPLLERLKFIIILSSNLDEFFMIRVAGLKSQISAGVNRLSYDGLTPKQQLIEIRKKLLPIYQRQEELLVNEILSELEQNNIRIHDFDKLNPEEKKYLEEYFINCIMPVLTPLTLDPAHPFPRLINRSLNIAFVLIDHNKEISSNRIAFIQIPQVLDRLIKLENIPGNNYILIEQVIKEYAYMLFPGLEVEQSNTFRVTRDADIEVAEDEADDLLYEISEQIKQRRTGRAAVRLEASSNMPGYLVNLLMNALGLEPDDVYTHNRPLNLPDFMELANIENRNLNDTPFTPFSIPEFLAEGIGVFDAIKKRDFLVHHPFDSFSNSTLKYINRAADDPDVAAIKITLYRTGMNSSVVEALKRAAENGKEVTAFVELKARFDEEKNIIWAKELEHAGAHVIYGIMGLKTHCKIAMVVRREAKKLKTYLHLSTGNYNQLTARLYTDLALFTDNEDFGKEAMHLFNYLTGYSYYQDWKNLIVAPINLKQRVIGMIRREVELHTPDNPGEIFVKMNSLANKDVITELYQAAQKGVKIKLLVRGICCLKPGMPGLSETIEVKSIIGRFLEHSRLFSFKNGGNRELYFSSADWMSRNLNNRIELMIPVFEESIKQQLIDILNLYWKDNTKSWRLLSNGNYEKLKPENGARGFSAQDYFLKNIKKNREYSGKLLSDI